MIRLQKCGCSIENYFPAGSSDCGYEADISENIGLGTLKTWCTVYGACDHSWPGGQLII